MHGTLHGMDTGSPNNLVSYGGKGKSSQSPLHKGFVNNAHSNSSKSNLSCTSSYVNSSENLPLPSMNSSFLEDGYLAYQLPPEKDSGGSSSAGTSATQLPTLSECLAMPEPVYGARDEAAVGRGIPSGGLQPDHLYYPSQFGAADVLPLQHQMAKPDQWADSSSLHSMLGSVIQSDQVEQEQDSGLQLVHLLLACADFRVASYFADALATRLSVSSGTAISRGAGAPYPFPPSADTLKIYQILYQACPYIKFAHFTANQAIFEAFHGEDRVHVVDLTSSRATSGRLSSRRCGAAGGPPTLRLTGWGHPATAVRETGRHLASLAASLRVPFEFHAAVADKLERLRPAALQRRVGEALAVNAVNRLHRVPGTHLGLLLSMIRDQAPRL
ncbi:hypothetical protein ZWY2020_010188 [Hordeum vulgare]|nr:hypothetical protein ZWY2020_010188 [Hordeum vulgare]